MCKFANVFCIDSFLLILILLFSLHYKYIFIVCAFIVCSEIDIAINMYSSYTAFGDLEIFLHGLGLEHMTDLLKVRFSIGYIDLMYVCLFVG